MERGVRLLLRHDWPAANPGLRVGCCALVGWLKRWRDIVAGRWLVGGLLRGRAAQPFGRCPPALTPASPIAGFDVVMRLRTRLAPMLVLSLSFRAQKNHSWFAKQRRGNRKTAEKPNRRMLFRRMVSEAHDRVPADARTPVRPDAEPLSNKPQQNTD